MASQYDGPHSLWTIQDGKIRLQATGLPYHSYGNKKSVDKPGYKNYDVTFTYRAGTNQKGSGQLVDTGIIGYWLNGVAMFNPSAGDSVPNGYKRIPKIHYNAAYQATKDLGYDFAEDLAGGHTIPSNTYHYHDFSFAGSWISGAGSIPASVGESEVRSIPYLKGGLTFDNGHSKILGFALDGYPVYGPYGFVSSLDSTSGVKVMKSGYALKDKSLRNTQKLNVQLYPMGMFVEDYKFVGNGDLDNHNGRYCITPDFPEGTYAYFVSTDINQNPVFPYVLGDTFYGDIPVVKPESPFVQVVKGKPVDISPSWNTPSGSLGKFVAGNIAFIALSASYSKPSTSVTYKLLNGTLPNGLKLDEHGLITGTPETVKQDTTYSFTIRAKDTTGLIKDRTFEMTITPYETVSIEVVENIIIDDSIWTEVQLKYSSPISVSSIKLSIANGKLPPGLEMNTTGLIRGYAKPPVTLSGTPATTKYKFTVKYENDLGTAIANYSITVKNQRLGRAANTRVPAILNKKPMTFVISKDDPYHDYYLTSNNIPVVNSGDFFTFKIIGHDFDNSELEYEFINLPEGITGDSSTGWVSGTPVLTGNGYNSFMFSDRVKKLNRETASKLEDFEYIVSKEIKKDIVWKTNSDLGTIFNNTISEFKVQAKSSNKLAYRFISGNLPPNLTVLRTGDISGKVVNQPTDKILLKDEVTTFKFVIEAYSIDYSLVTSQKEFTINVKQYYTVPTETMYFRANPSLADRKIIDSLLNNESLIPTKDLYKAEDPYFGKAKDIKFVQVYGINANTIEQYIAAIEKNHYWRYVVLGDLKTAVAKDDNGNIIYEVVYSEITDDLSNSKGDSIRKTVIWPRQIPLTGYDRITSEEIIYTSYENDLSTGNTYYTSLAETYADRVYPASFQNMRKQIASVLEENYDSRLLPKWMSSQQRNGNVLGYVQAWVICYTLPNKSEAIVNKIKANWGHNLNEIYFALDRYTVDKSNTYDYNKYLATPSWENLPSSSPAPNPLDSKDFYVLFPRKTILPRQDY